MANNNKKKEKLIERIKELEDNLLNSLTKKSSNSIEINVGSIQTEISRLKKQLSEL